MRQINHLGNLYFPCQERYSLTTAVFNEMISLSNCSGTATWCSLNNCAKCAIIVYVPWRKYRKYFVITWKDLVNTIYLKYRVNHVLRIRMVCELFRIESTRITSCSGICSVKTNPNALDPNAGSIPNE